jgi:type I restriction enzyme, S subunit
MMTPVPESWETVSLGELGEWQGGGTPSKAVSAYWNGTIPWVSPKDMKTSSIVVAEDHITSEAIKNRRQIWSLLAPP